MRLLSLVLVLIGVTPELVASAPADEAQKRSEARLLNRWARDALAERTLESRRRALRHIDDAIKLEPENADHWLVLGEVKAVRLDPELPVTEGSSFVDSEGLRPVGRLWGSAYTLLGEVRIIPRPEL